MAHNFFRYISSHPFRRVPATCVTAFLLLLGTTAFLSSCSFSSKEKDPPTRSTSSEEAHQWMADGTIMLSRSIPTPRNSTRTSGLGFLPTLGALGSTWLAIDTKHGIINLMEGDKITVTTKGTGLNALKAGHYQLILKQRNPLWYAPASYFSDRLLTVPPEGDKSRFRRGALGDFVLYIDKETPLHSGPIWTKDIGGIKVDESSLSKMYYLLNVGSSIEVK